ncbi:MAG TPA: NUDIX domain-containing protein [Stellaceae bacterium]|nr:NUDIX domain-containing protein [Stellaceae bacterium]
MPVRPVPAATLLLVRDGQEGIEVLLATRHDAAGFAAGATVFPGGKLDTGDHALAGTGDPLRVAAIREAFEECGILLARRAGALLSGAELARLTAPRSSTIGFGAFVESAGLALATDLLVPFAHWITPADQPKRFDTHFFLAPAPAEQVARHDGREATIVHWLTAEGAIAAARLGEIKLVLPTRLNLLKLGRSRTVAEALEAARRSAIVTVQPEIVDTAAGPAFQIPAAADYGVTEILVSHYRRT